MNFSSMLFPLLILALALPLFLSARKQKRSMQQMQQLQRSLVPGDRVMTTSGMHATVVDTSDEDTIDLEVAPGVRTTWVRAAVRERVQDTDADQGGPGEEDDEQEPAASDVTEEKSAQSAGSDAGAETPGSLEREKNRS